MSPSNLFDHLPFSLESEVFSTLFENSNVRIERIVSSGQSTPPGEWFDQDQDEWVILLKGGAGLIFEDQPQEQVLKPGDYLYINAHRRHRVEWTAEGEPTIWLAVHFPTGKAPS